MAGEAAFNLMTGAMKKSEPDVGLFSTSEDSQKKMSLALSARAMHWQLRPDDDDGPAQSVDTQKPPTAAATKPRLLQLQPLARQIVCAPRVSHVVC